MAFENKDTHFKVFVSNIFEQSYSSYIKKIQKTNENVINNVNEVVHKLTNGKNLEIFHSAFTSADVNPPSNYEWLENLGDTVHSTWLVHHIFQNYPEFRTKDGVRTVARLKIKYCAGKELAKVADKQGFWEFIRASESAVSRDKSKLLEDVFEAFIGACFFIGNEISPNFGSILAFAVLDSFYSTQKFDLNNLFDCKTILKEMCDKNKEMKLRYKSKRVNEVFITSINLNDGREIGFSTGCRKQVESEQAAAKMAIAWLNNPKNCLNNIETIFSGLNLS